MLENRAFLKNWKLHDTYWPNWAENNTYMNQTLQVDPRPYNFK